MSAVFRLDKNTRGRDFVVGDIHGCFSALSEKLVNIGFDEKSDRLFSVGDLVDRGPESALAFDWIKKPWFYAVRGNHDQMVIDSVVSELSISNHVINGGAWFYEVPHDERMQMARAFDELPIAIEIGSGAERVAILHGEVFGGMSWDDFSARLESGCERARLSAMWGREKIKAGDSSVVDGVAAVYVGHTPVELPCRLGNVHYIDTGACYGRGFQVVELLSDIEPGASRMKRPNR